MPSPVGGTVSTAPRPVRNLIEFPDRCDPMVQRLLSGKSEGSNPDYEKAVFEQEFATRFTIDRSASVSETRTLYEARPQA